MDALTSQLCRGGRHAAAAAAWLRLDPVGRVGGCCHQQRSSEHSWSARAVPENGGSRSSVHAPGAVVIHRLRCTNMDYYSHDLVLFGICSDRFPSLSLTNSRQGCNFCVLGNLVALYGCAAQVPAVCALTRIALVGTCFGTLPHAGQLNTVQLELILLGTTQGLSYLKLLSCHRSRGGELFYILPGG